MCHVCETYAQLLRKRKADSQPEGAKAAKAAKWGSAFCESTRVKRKADGQPEGAKAIKAAKRGSAGGELTMKRKASDQLESASVVKAPKTGPALIGGITKGREGTSPRQAVEHSPAPLSSPAGGCRPPVATLSSPAGGCRPPVATLSSPAGGCRPPVATLSSPAGGCRPPVATLSDELGGADSPPSSGTPRGKLRPQRNRPIQGGALTAPRALRNCPTSSRRFGLPIHNARRPQRRKSAGQRRRQRLRERTRSSLAPHAPPQPRWSRPCRYTIFPRRPPRSSALLQDQPHIPVDWAAARDDRWACNLCPPERLPWRMKWITSISGD